MTVDAIHIADLETPVGLNGAETDTEVAGPPCIIIAIVLIFVAESAN